MAVCRSADQVSEPQGWFPQTDADYQAIHEQLRRLLASPVFARSKGCSNLLAHIVTQTLKGRAEQLKDRTIGVEVFGRAPDYDTASDHVVRSTAGEVRKRLAQYYAEPERLSEIRIDVPPGSYVPKFSKPRVTAVGTGDSGSGDVARPSGPEERSVLESVIGYSGFRTVGVLAAIVTVVVLLAFLTHAYSTDSSKEVLEQFWEPVLDSPSPVLFCIGDSEPPASAAQPGSPQPTQNEPRMVLSPDGGLRGGQRVFLNDAIALARIAGYLGRHGRPYYIRLHSGVTFSDLQNSPAILIGLRNNLWTASLTGPIRFSVERGNSPGVFILRDKNNPLLEDWSVNLSTPYNQSTKDYALVARELNPKTGQIVVTIGGITRHGTLAASEFVTNPEQFAKLKQYGPANLRRKNIAIVLSTEVIRGSPGSAKIVAADFW